MSVAQKSFGTTKNGEEVTLYTITNKNNVSVSVIDYGANLVSLMVPDKNGNVEDIVLGFDNVAGYEVNGCFSVRSSDVMETASAMPNLS